MKVVILQPMYMPWIGYFQQILAAEIFVFLDHVEFSRGSFTNRVQIKLEKGLHWLTVPLKSHANNTAICDLVTHQTAWNKKQLSQLQQAYGNAPFGKLMLDWTQVQLEGKPSTNLSSMLITSIKTFAHDFLPTPMPSFLLSSEMGHTEKKGDLVLAILQTLGADVYLTGWGAYNYMDHESFEAVGIEVRYFDYHLLPYTQLHGAFTPFVSILDRLAHLGPFCFDGVETRTVHWRDFDTLNKKPI